MKEICLPFPFFSSFFFFFCLHLITPEPFSSPEGVVICACLCQEIATFRAKVNDKIWLFPDAKKAPKSLFIFFKVSF